MPAPCVVLISWGTRAAIVWSGSASIRTDWLCPDAPSMTIPLKRTRASCLISEIGWHRTLLVAAGTPRTGSGREHRTEHPLGNLVRSGLGRRTRGGEGDGRGDFQ